MHSSMKEASSLGRMASVSAPMLMRAGRSVLAVLSVLLACQLVAAQGLTVAAASDLQSALPTVVSQFERETGQQVSLTLGSSGNFLHADSTMTKAKRGSRKHLVTTAA